MAQPVDEYAIMLNPWFGQYTDASFEQQQAEVSLALTAASRAAALAKLHDDGWSLAAIAEACGLTRTRVCQFDRPRPARPSRGVGVSVEAQDVLRELWRRVAGWMRMRQQQTTTTTTAANS